MTPIPISVIRCAMASTSRRRSRPRMWGVFVSGVVAARPLPRAGFRDRDAVTTRAYRNDLRSDRTTV
ncbi:hypothetical protein GCM10010201_33930 [Pilimelia columellifera subsp. columellifera]|uniref:Uncharacterized protein n=1 Tax=Pilimelia columellifera subsp. columellifera TaxID=706583 RepID=A0ABN3NSS0_9ACTN